MFIPLNPKTFLLLNPVKLLPLASHGANLFNLCPFPDSPALYVQYLFPIGPAVSPLFPGFLIVDPLNPPPNAALGYRGANYFSLCLFPDESTDLYRVLCQSVHPFGSFPRLKCVTAKPPEMPPGALRGELYLAICIFQEESTDMYQMWCQSFEPFDSFTIHLNL